MELNNNYWGGEFSAEEEDPSASVEIKVDAPETTEAITESDRVRARVAVSRGESELYFIKIPNCDYSKLETHPAGGDVYEIVYNGTVFGYTTNKNAFGAKEGEIKYQ